MHHADPQRLHALDAVRGFALLLGVAFHAALSFMPGWPPGIWAMVDNSPSPFLADAAFVAHIFRMTLFFLLAGFFARLLHQRLGTGGFWKNRLLRIAVPLVAGWVLLYPLIMWIWIAGVSKSFGGHPPPMPEMPKTAGTFPWRTCGSCTSFCSSMRSRCWSARWWSASTVRTGCAARPMRWSRACCGCRWWHCCSASRRRWR